MDLRRLLAVFLGLIGALGTAGTALGQVVTYQGVLEENGSAVSGPVEVRATLFAAETGGSAVAGPVVVAGVDVDEGVFTVELDFGGGAFDDGGDRWLEIGVDDGGGLVTLDGRQRVAAAPIAEVARRALSGPFVPLDTATPSSSGLPAGTEFEITFMLDGVAYEGFELDGPAVFGFNPTQFGGDLITFEVSLRRAYDPSRPSLPVFASAGANQFSLEMTVRYVPPPPGRRVELEYDTGSGPAVQSLEMGWERSANGGLFETLHVRRDLVPLQRKLLSPSTPLDLDLIGVVAPSPRGVSGGSTAVTGGMRYLANGEFDPFSVVVEPPIRGGRLPQTITTGRLMTTVLGGDIWYDSFGPVPPPVVSFEFDAVNPPELYSELTNLRWMLLEIQDDGLPALVFVFETQ